MGWLVFFGFMLVLGLLLWRREHRGTRGGYARPSERGAEAARQADAELRNATGRGMSGNVGGGGPGW